MKSKRVYTGKWNGYGLSVHIDKQWSRQWTRLWEKATGILFRHTGLQTLGWHILAEDLPKIARGTIVRFVIEELVEDADADREG